MMVDSNIWIFSEIDAYPENKAARVAIQKLLLSGSVFTNDIIISETFHKLSVLVGKQKAKTTTEIMLGSESVLYLPVEKDTIERALALSLKDGMRINDAIIAQQCLENKIPLLTDNVKDFRRTSSLKLLPFREQ